MMEKNRDALKLQYYLSHPDDMLFAIAYRDKFGVDFFGRPWVHAAGENLNEAFAEQERMTRDGYLHAIVFGMEKAVEPKDVTWEFVMEHSVANWFITKEDEAVLRLLNVRANRRAILDDMTLFVDETQASVYDELADEEQFVYLLQNEDKIAIAVTTVDIMSAGLNVYEMDPAMFVEFYSNEDHTLKEVKDAVNVSQYRHVIDMLWRLSEALGHNMHHYTV